MSVAALLTEVRRAGVSLSVRGDRLLVTARAGVVTSHMRQELVAAKPQLLELLTAKPIRSAGLCRVDFRLKVDAPGIWHTALGPDQTELLVDLRARYRERLDGLRPYPLCGAEVESEPTKFP
jgi:hypothetical protein